MKKTKKQTYGFGCCGKWMVVLLLGGGAIYLLLPEFRPQIINALPFLLLLLCPVMHLFMHRGHGRQHGVTTKSNNRESRGG